MEETRYTLQDIVNITQKVAMVLKLSRSSFAFEDKDFSPQDIVIMLDKYYSAFHHQFTVTLTVEEVREICNILYKAGEFSVLEKNRDIFSRSLYCSPLLQANIIKLAPYLLETKPPEAENHS
jgi:hypothetical protein